MTKTEFLERTKQFALAVVTLVEDLPVGRSAIRNPQSTRSAFRVPR